MKPGSIMLYAGLILTALNTNAYSATYPGQGCVGRYGASLYYSTTGAQNTGSSTISISCPVARLKDGGTAGVTPVIYFINDGKTKSCYFDNYNIDTGGLWSWTSASGVRRLALPTLSPTHSWYPLAFNCSLPSQSKVTGYYFSE